MLDTIEIEEEILNNKNTRNYNSDELSKTNSQSLLINGGFNHQPNTWFAALLIVLILPLNHLNAQKIAFEGDFYEYVVGSWADSIKLEEKIPVINNWGLLWDDIMDKSVEILSTNNNYNLDNQHLELLEKLRVFYSSTADYSTSKRKRVRLVQETLPMHFGVIFSKVTIDNAKMEIVNQLIDYTKQAYELKINNSDKICDAYRAMFLAKLKNMNFIIGAPDISVLPKLPEFTPEDLKQNVKIAQKLQENMTNESLLLWNNPPFETDCRYNYGSNAVILYAGILYNEDVSDYSTLFATIGRTIAHEITHAFDETGKDFDKDGNNVKRSLKSKYTEKQMKTTYNELIDQYDGYYVHKDIKVDGKKTAQENYADLGGIEVSLFALELYQTENFPEKTKKVKDKEIAKYFKEFANFWREKSTVDFVKASVTRMHTPQKFRAIGVIYNQDEFYNLYEVSKSDKYYIPSEQRVKIW
jgi:putative endopeptidase